MGESIGLSRCAGDSLFVEVKQMSEDWFDGETAGFDAEMGEPLVIEETTTIEITEETTIEEIGTNGMSFDAIVSVFIKIFGLTMEQAIRLATRILREGIKTFFTLGGVCRGLVGFGEKGQ